MWPRFRNVLREFGATAGLLYLADRALRGLSQGMGLYVYELMCQPIDERPVLPARMSNSIAFRTIERGGIELDLMPARPEIKQARYEAGARCLGVERNGVLVGYVWLSLGDYAEDEVRCIYGLPHGGDAAFDFDLYVFPEHRMGIGFAAIWHAGKQYLHSLGVRGSYSRMARFNLPSRRAHLRMGSRIIGRVLVLRLWALEILLATVWPFCSVTWGPRSHRPRLRLPPLPAASAAPASSRARDLNVASRESAAGTATGSEPRGAP
jgi:hypothetical protein